MINFAVVFVIMNVNSFGEIFVSVVVVVFGVVSVSAARFVVVRGMVVLA